MPYAPAPPAPEKPKPQDPVVLSVSPTNGPVFGGTSITVTGLWYGFFGARILRLLKVYSTPTLVQHSQEVDRCVV